jgi:hypothetical protein
LVVGIEPELFHKVSYFQEDFFLFQSPENTLKELSKIEGGMGLIVSFALNYPYAEGYNDPTLGPSVFQRNENITFSLERPYQEKTYQIRILDIAQRFPAIAEMVGKVEEDIPFVITDTRFLLEPLPGQSRALLDNVNASHFFIKTDSNVDLEEVAESINAIYQSNYPHTYSLVMETIDDHLGKQYRLGSLLVGLTELEFILVLIVLLFILFLYLFSSMKQQEREFATLSAIGWPVNLSIRFIWFSLLLIWLLSSFLALFMSFICTYVYIPLLSDLLLFSLSQYSVNWIAWLLAEGVLTLSLLICLTISWYRLKSSPTALILREE